MYFLCGLTADCTTSDTGSALVGQIAVKGQRSKDKDLNVWSDDSEERGVEQSQKERRSREQRAGPGVRVLNEEATKG